MDLTQYYPEIPYHIEMAKDLLAKMNKKPSAKNGLYLEHLIKKIGDRNGTKRRTKEVCI